MRTYDELADALMRAVPEDDELAALATWEIEKLRKYCNCIDNVLYLATPKGRALLAAAQVRRESGSR